LIGQLLSCILAFLFLGILAPPSVAQGATTTAERERQRLESVRKQRAELEKKLKQTEHEHAATTDQLKATDQAISAIGRKLRELGEARLALERDLGERERALREMEVRITADQERLAHLLRHQFRPQEAEALAVLLAGGDPHEAARERYFLALLSRAQAELIARMRHDAMKRRQLAEEVRERGEAMAALSRQEENERASLRQRQQERQAVLASITREIGQQKRQIGVLRQDERRLAGLIESITRKRAARPTRPARPATPAAPARAPEARSAEPVGASGAFARLRGKLPMPVRGEVAGRFGARRDDGQTTWKGLFIRAPEGAEVRSIAPGEVVFADWLRGYGNLIIIDHDDNFLSVYGYNQSLLADVGQKVGAGKTVATVGASGGQAQSGLYFQLRHRGQAFDPGRWLGKR